MKGFISKLFTGAAFILAIATIAQVGILMWTRGKNTNQHDTFLVFKNQPNDVVFLGASRCAQHFVPKVFKDSLGVICVNLGIYAHPDLPITIAKLESYLKYNPAPKFAVLNWDISCTYGPDKLEDNTDMRMKDCYARYAFFAQDDNRELVKYFHFNPGEQYVPLYAVLKYKQFWNCLFMADGGKWQRDGIVTDNEIIRINATRVARAQAVLDTQYNHFVKHYDAIKSQLHGLDALCKKHNIKLICVQTPVCAGIDNRRIFVLPSRMCNELGISCINGCGAEITDNLGNFNNVIHLNPAGAARFSGYLCRNGEFLHAIGLTK